MRLAANQSFYCYAFRSTKQGSVMEFNVAVNSQLVETYIHSDSHYVSQKHETNLIRNHLYKYSTGLKVAFSDKTPPLKTNILFRKK